MKISLNNWCFEKDEIVKLIWIDEPFRIEEQWKVSVYFRSLITNIIERIIIDWGAVALLKIGELYSNGSEIKVKNEIDNIFLKTYNADTNTFVLNGARLRIQKTLFDVKMINCTTELQLKSFVCEQNSMEYHIPVIEVLRSLIARNKRLLYASLKPNSLQELFSWYKEADKLIIAPTKYYPKYLMRTNKHVQYLAWLLTNEDAIRAWGAIYENLLVKDEMEFPFPIQNEFSIKARFKEVNNVVRIEQIYNFEGAEIDCNIIEVKNVVVTPSKSNNSVNIKISKSNIGEEVTVSAEKGARKKESLIDNKRALFEVVNQAKIYYVNEDETTNNSNNTINIKEKIDFQKVSLAESLSESNVDSLEFEENEDEAFDMGDLSQMINVLENIQKNYNVEISYVVKDLPEVEKRCSFRYKSDDEVRKYLLAQIQLDYKCFYLIEIERGGKSLSTLILYENSYQPIKAFGEKAEKIVHALLDNNGSWDKQTTAQQGLQEDRLRHYRGNNIHILGWKYYHRIRRK